MKCLAIMVVLAVAACRPAQKPEATGSGSTAAGSSVAPPIAATPATPQAPPRAQVSQPTRSPADAVRVAEVERALTAAIAHAKEAKTLKDACTGLNELAEKISAFHAVVPPAGFEQAFNGARNGIDMKIDVIQEQRCSEDSGLDADTIHSELDGLHERFVELQGIGAKP